MIQISLQTQTIAARPEGWSALLPFQQFDPSLGTLIGVQVMVNGTLSGSISLENLGSAAATISVTLPGTMEISDGGVDLGDFNFGSAQGTVDASNDPAATASLAAFDGTKDYAGSSGTVIAETFGVDSSFGEGDPAEFIGTGTVDLTLTSDGSSAVSGNAALRSLLDINTGGVVTLQYQYLPPGELADLGDNVFIVSAIAPATVIDEDTVYLGTGQTTVAQTVTIPDQISGWSTLVTVNKFDPSLGSLREVIVTIRNDLTGTVALENLDAQGWRVGFDQSAAVSVTAPGTGTLTPAEVFDDSTSLLNLGAYDGTADFAGTSGTIVSFSTADPLAQVTVGGGDLTDAADLADFTGSGTIALAVSSTGQSDMVGPPDLLDEIAQSTGATISVSYVYGTTPADPTDYAIETTGSSVALPVPVGAATGSLPTFTAALAIPSCFAAGTRIATSRGNIAVERLREGDIVLTVSGGRQRISWIGHRRVDCRRHPTPDRVMPVRIAAHAFGEGRPRRPVLLSPDHAVFAEDVLIPIKFLVNGHTITQIDVDLITYYHLELPRHDVISAEGLPAESYLETGGRAAFENAEGPIALHPDFVTDEAGVASVWRQSGYAPLLGGEGQLHTARLKVLLQAQLLASGDRDRPKRPGLMMSPAA